MTRYTRGTRSTTHHRGKVGSATPWESFAAQPPSRTRRKTPVTATDPSDKCAVPEASTVDGNGKAPPPSPVKLVKLFGLYWMTQGDARRLQKLKVKMKSEGTTRKLITEALRNEIRKAEMKLKRMKEKTCFNCRQFGHLCADCPNNKGNNNDPINKLIEHEESGEICFKCGSMEHTSRNCLKNKNNEDYKFAECFICHEFGHISRQCPNNGNGIYPSGGHCKGCGAKTHLAKDCDKFVHKARGENQASEDSEATCALVLDPKMPTEYEPDEAFSLANNVLKNIKRTHSGTGKSTKIDNVIPHDKNIKKRRVKF